MFYFHPPIAPMRLYPIPAAMDNRKAQGAILATAQNPYGISTIAAAHKISESTNASQNHTFAVSISSTIDFGVGSVSTKQAQAGGEPSATRKGPSRSAIPDGTEEVGTPAMP